MPKARLPTRTITTKVHGLPVHRDLLEANLDDIYPAFAGTAPIMWGLAVGAASNAWRESTRVQGMDWEARLHIPGDLTIPVTTRRSETEGRVTWRKIPKYCALVIVQTDSTSLNAARDVGRTRVRALLGLIRRELPSIQPSDVLWEGGIASIGARRTRMTAAGSHLEAAQAQGTHEIHQTTNRLLAVRIATLPPHATRSLEWLTLSRSARVRAEKFMHLWLACITLASFGQPKGDKDMPRLRKYVESMGSGRGGVRSVTRINEMVRRFRRYHAIRNDLVHRSDESGITATVLDDLERDAFELVDFEFAKMKIRI